MAVETAVLHSLSPEAAAGACWDGGRGACWDGGLMVSRCFNQQF